MRTFFSQFFLIIQFMKSKFLLSFGNAKSWLFCAVCFVLPMKVSYVYSLSSLLLIAWIIEGDIKKKFTRVVDSKLCLACVTYFFIYALSMLWTEDVKAGWHMVGRQVPFLLFPLFYTSAETEMKEKYITAFIMGVCVCALLAHYNFIQLHYFTGWPRGIRVYKGPADTAPFVDWIMYVPILAIGAYFCLRRVLFFSERNLKIKWGLAACLLLSNLSFSGGRAGMVMFAALLFALFFERIHSRWRAFLACAICFPLFFSLTYKTVDSFAVRVDHAVNDILEFKSNPNTSVGLRLVFWATSAKVFYQNPIFGVGSGDFPSEYAMAKPDYWAHTPNTVNPHNQFLMTAATTGLLGLMTLLYIFFMLFRKGDSRTRSLIFGYVVLCMFESYLWRSNTAMTFFVLVAGLIQSNKTLVNDTPIKNSLSLGA